MSSAFRKYCEWGQSIISRDPGQEDERFAKFGTYDKARSQIIFNGAAHLLNAARFNGSDGFTQGRRAFAKPYTARLN